MNYKSNDDKLRTRGNLKNSVSINPHGGKNTYYKIVIKKTIYGF